jgi:hypothetical protein
MRFEFRAMEGHGMLADGDSGAGEIGDQPLFDRSSAQRRGGIGSPTSAKSRQIWGIHCFRLYRFRRMLHRWMVR